MELYSKKLNKFFAEDEKERLLAEEDAFDKKEAEKKLAEEAKAKEKKGLLEKKRARAKEIEDAYRGVEKIRAEAHKKELAAKKAADEKLAAFLKDYGYYHTTYTTVPTYTSVFDLFDIFDGFFR